MGYKGRLALLIAGQLAVLAGIALFVYRPSLAEIDEVEMEISQMSSKQAELCTVLEQRPKPDADIARSMTEIEKLERRIPPESRVSWLSARIADTMQTHSIDLRSATQWSDGGQHPAVPELKRLKKSVSVRCTAQRLQAFLEAINKLSFLVIVEDLMVTRDRQWGAVSAKINLTTFVLRSRSAVSQAGPATFGRDRNE